jgi:pimeloyl-ACP methyl ester carboxylesterase
MKYSFGSSGGGSNFMNFLEKELIAEIESKYRTNGYRIFIGHSFGGLTVLNTLLTKKELFNAYIAIDPSVWWDNEYILKLAQKKLQREDFSGKVLFLSQANKIPTPQDSTTDHQDAILAFKSELENATKNNLLWKYQFYEDEDHGTVPLISEYYGLRFIYKGFQTEVKMVGDNPELLMQNYRNVSERLYFTTIPSEWLTDWIAGYCIKTQRPNNAKVLYELNKQLYPKSQHAIDLFNNLAKPAVLE